MTEETETTFVPRYELTQAKDCVQLLSYQVEDLQKRLRREHRRGDAMTCAFLFAVMVLLLVLAYLLP